MIGKILKKIKQTKSEKDVLKSLSEEDAVLVKEVTSKKLTYLTNEKLVALILELKRLETENVSGDIIEAGCALGGSSIILAKKKGSHSRLKVYDVFGMIPAPTEEDSEDVHERYKKIVSGESKGIKGDSYYGYEEDLYEKVKENLASFNVDVNLENVELIKGLLQDTMNLTSPVAMAHIDVDWYDPVLVSIQRIWPRLARGGVIILDDYNYWGGCKKAADEFYNSHRSEAKLELKMDTARLIKL